MRTASTWAPEEAHFFCQGPFKVGAWFCGDIVTQEAFHVGAEVRYLTEKEIAEQRHLVERAGGEEIMQFVSKSGNVATRAVRCATA